MKQKSKPYIPGIYSAFVGRVLSVSAIRLSPTVLMLLNYALIARLFSPEDVGVYLIVFGLGTTLGTCISLGIPDGIVPYISEHKMRHGLGGLGHGVWMTFLTILAVFGAFIIVTTGVFLASKYINWTPEPRLLQIVWFSVAAAGPYAFLFFFSQTLLALNRPQLALALAYWPTPVVLLIASLFASAFYSTPPVTVLLSALPIAWLGAAIFGGICVMRIVKTEQPGMASPGWQKSIVAGLPMLGTRTVTNLDAWSPVWLSGLLLSIQDAGVFGAALRLIGGFMAIPQAIWFVSRATIAQLIARHDYSGLEALMRLQALGVGGLMACIALLCWAGGDAIMTFVFGSDYADGSVVLALFTTAYALQLLTGGIDMALLMGGRERFLFKVNALSVPLTLAGLAAGFLLFGIMGGAAAFAIVRVAKFVVLLVASQAIFGFWSIPTFDRARLARGAAIFAHRREK